MKNSTANQPKMAKTTKTPATKPAKAAAAPVTEISEVVLPVVSVEITPEEPANAVVEPTTPTAEPATQPAAQIVPIPATTNVAKGTKTQGIYQLTSRQNSIEDFKMVGSSSQIEVCTRDYMSWCKKAKAPKSMQAEYDRVSRLADLKPGEIIDPTILFKVEILRVCKTAEELDSAKLEFGLVKVKAATPTPEQVTEKLKMHAAIAAVGNLLSAPTKDERPNYMRPAAQQGSGVAVSSGEQKPYKINLERPIGWKRYPQPAAAI